MIYNSFKYADTFTQLVEMISKRLSNCERFQEVSDFVTLIPMEELIDFGFHHPTDKDDWLAYKDTDHKCRRHSVILNMQVCEEARFTLAEMEAAILHELGHILNDCEKQGYSLEQFKSTGEHYSKYLDRKKSIHDKYILEKEFLADEYANFHGCARELISGMNKYLALDFAQNKDLFRLRLERLESDMKPILSGKIKEFKIPI